jgi:hypothetical protein
MERKIVNIGIFTIRAGKVKKREEQRKTWMGWSALLLVELGH